MYKIISSKYIYRGKVFSLRNDKVIVSGTDQILSREIIEHPGSVAIIPIDDDDNVYMVSQYRHPAGKVLMEIPAGTLNKGESSFDCAKRELREEIGMLPNTLISLGQFYLAPGYSSEKMYVFLGKDLDYLPLSQDDDENISVHIVPLVSLMQQMNNGDIVDMKTIASLLLFSQRNDVV